MKETIIRVEGMHCEGCSSTVSHFLRNLVVGLEVSVDLEGGKVRLRSSGNLPEEQRVRAAVEEAGFKYRGEAE